MKKVIMLKGLPASGKSTYAKSVITAEGAEKVKRVNKDELRKMLDYSIHTKENEQFVLKVRNFIVERALRDDITIIVDDTNLVPYHEETLRQIAAEHGAEFEVVLFDTPIEECILRDSKRVDSVGAKVIQDMASRWNVVELYDEDPERPDCVICDIDGTISKMHDREPFEWSKVGNDIPVQKVIEIVKQASDGKQLIFLSGRDGVCEKETKEWLQQHFPDREFLLYMRNADDNRKDFLVKKELFNEHIRGRWNVFCVFDDRDQSVKLWRDIGLQCFQVNYGNF